MESIKNGIGSKIRGADDKIWEDTISHFVFRDRTSMFYTTLSIKDGFRFNIIDNIADCIKQKYEKH